MYVRCHTQVHRGCRHRRDSISSIIIHGIQGILALSIESLSNPGVKPSPHITSKFPCVLDVHSIWNGSLLWKLLFPTTKSFLNTTFVGTTHTYIVRDKTVPTNRLGLALAEDGFAFVVDTWLVRLSFVIFRIQGSFRSPMRSSLCIWDAVP